MTRGFLLSKPIVTGSAIALLATSSSPLGRWLGDDLDGNNPPKKNYELPASVNNTFVRVGLWWEDGPGTVRSSGVVVGARRDMDSELKALPTGRLCILTADHAVQPPADAKDVNLVIVFGNGQKFKVPEALKVDRTYRAPLNADGKTRPDLAVVGVPITDWARQVPSLATYTLGDVSVKYPIMAGYGRQAYVDPKKLTYKFDPDSYGTLGTGPALYDEPVLHQAEGPEFTKQVYKYDSLQFFFGFDSFKEPTLGYAYCAEGDSGGPTIQGSGDNYRLVGIHGATESTKDGLVILGYNCWDVRVNTYLDWVNMSIKSALAPQKPLP